MTLLPPLDAYARQLSLDGACAVCQSIAGASNRPAARFEHAGNEKEKAVNCPVCEDVMLVMADRQGIEIDYCPRCRGVWLDRGELDKIIDRTGSGGAPARRADEASGQRGSGNEYRRGDPRHRKRKRKGFLSELFEFD